MGNHRTPSEVIRNQKKFIGNLGDAIVTRLGNHKEAGEIRRVADNYNGTDLGNHRIP